MTKKETLKQKLKLIIIIFTPRLRNQKGEYIDYRNIDQKAENYVTYHSPISKDDFNNINEAVSKLIKILSLNESKILKDYVVSKLCFDRELKPFNPPEKWIKAYKELIKLIKEKY